jgi:hypothetical protein
MSAETCRENGGVWADGEPCGMDAPRGQRCDWHTEGIAAALAVAVRTGMVDLTTGRLLGDPVGVSRTLATASLDRVVAVQRDPANDAEVARLLGWLAEHGRHLWAYWDCVSVPGTDDAIARADEHRAHLRRLREELGGRLAVAGFHAALERYRATPGKRWPLRHQRHGEDCDQPSDEQGRSLCDCPVQFDWEGEGER